MAEPPLSSVGEMLRKAREKKKLDLEQVNRETKISILMLSALEQDDFDTFESDTYLRGFLKNYARFLGLDIEHVLNTLERQRGRVPRGKGALWDIEEMKTEEKLRSPRIVSRLIVPVLVIVVIILFILLARKQREINELKRSGRLIEQRMGDWREAGVESLVLIAPRDE